MDAVLLLLLVARIRGKAVPTDDKSYRGSDRDACRENGGPNRDTTPLPLPLLVQRLDRWIVSTPSSTFFVRFSSVLERFGRRGSRNPANDTPSSSNPRPLAVSCSISSLSVPLHLPPPPPPRPCLSVSPGSGQRTRQAGQRT